MTDTPKAEKLDPAWGLVSLEVVVHLLGLVHVCLAGVHRKRSRAVVHQERRL